MDARTKEFEPAAVKTIIVNQPFGFFDRPVPTGDDEIMETADIRNLNLKQPIGGLIGSAKTDNGKGITGNDSLQVTFEIRSKAERPGQTHQILTGHPFHNPVFFMETPQGLFASLGEKSGQNAQSIVFNRWVEITNRREASKSDIANMVKNNKAQPRSIRLSDLPRTKFKIT